MNNYTTFSDLPKYLMIERGKETMYFHPVVIKWEWDGHSNAYYAMYAKFNPRSCTLNLSKVLFWVSAGSYEAAQDAFVNKVNKMRHYIDVKTWKGDLPVKLDLANAKSYKL